MTSETHSRLVPQISGLKGSLLAACAIVVLGTVFIDSSRAWLLVVPFSFLLTAYTTGAWVNERLLHLEYEPNQPPARLAINLGVGLACLSLFFTISALSGTFWLAALGAVALSAVGVVRLVRAYWPLQFGRASLNAMLDGMVPGFIWLIAWLWVTIPPTFFDELAYHLVIPQRALSTNHLLTAPWVFFTLMPHASDLLLAWGMSLGGEFGARATLFALWIACSLGAWGLFSIVSPRQSRWGLSLVGIALATSPTLWFLATLPFSETCLTAAIISATLFLFSPQRDRLAWLPFGLILGLAATAKLSGAFWVIAALIAALVSGWPIAQVCRAAFVVLASMTPWMARAWHYTGNPIYPLGYKLMASPFWTEENQRRVLSDMPYGTERLDVWGIIRLPLDLLLHPERFGSASDAGIASVLALCIVLGLPLIARLVRLNERFRRMSDAVAIFLFIAGAFWVFTSPTTRFFAPALAIGLTLLVSCALYLPVQSRTIAMVFMIIGGVWGTVSFIKQHNAVFSSFRVALGQQNPSAYLSRELDHYGAARFVRETLPIDSRLLFIGETRPYYFARDSVAPSAYDTHPLQKWVKESNSPEDLAKRIASEGITHVVLNTREFRRLHNAYHLLSFEGEAGMTETRRLTDLPRSLQLLFNQNGVYVFAVPSIGMR